MALTVRPMLRHLTPGNLVRIKGDDTRKYGSRHWIHVRHPMHDRLGIVIKYPASTGVWGLSRVMCLGQVVDLFHDCVRPLDDSRSNELPRGPPET